MHSILRAALGASLAAHALADVTISIHDVPPLPLNKEAAVTSAADLWARSCPEEHAPKTPYNASLLLSGYTTFMEPEKAAVFPAGTVYPSSDSFVRGALEAWAQHQHLVLRPDEVWFEVLTQLNFFMGANAKGLRHLFVDFDGKQEIVVERYTWKDVVAAFAGEIQKRVKTDWLAAWINPGFSTSTENDGLTATVLMMGLVKQYFTFTGGIICGLPKVTLLGTKDDWNRLLGKLNRLQEFGEDPALYAANLRPIFKRFVRTFDEPDSEDIKNFWGQIVRAEHHSTCGAGPVEYSITGWVMGFLHWTENGDLRVPHNQKNVYIDKNATVLDGVVYVQAPMDKLPVGYAKVPMKMLDFPSAGEESYAYLIAGNMGVNRTEATGDEKYVRAQPMSSWFMYGPVDKSYNATGALGDFGELNGITNGMFVQKACPGYRPPVGDQK